LAPTVSYIGREIGEAEAIFAAGEDVAGESAQPLALAFAAVVELVRVRQQELLDQAGGLLHRRSTDRGELHCLGPMGDEVQDDGEDPGIGFELADMPLEG